MTAPRTDLLKAIDLAFEDWDAAHRLVQRYEDDPTAAWIHAVLHKIEGDAGNSRYWYHRANRLERFPDDPRTELAAIRASVSSGGTTDGSRGPRVA